MNNEMLLLFLIESGDKAKVQEYVLKSGIPKDSKWIDYILLRTAVRKNDVDIAQFLIEHGCRVIKNVKRSINSLLHIAFENDSIEMVNLLQKNGASFTQTNQDGETALTFGIRSMIKSLMVDVKVLDVLLENGADINTCISNGTTLLHLAMLKMDVRLVKYLTQRKADVNCVDKIHGNAPLHIAVKRGSLKMVKLLLKHGADIHLRNKNGWSPLHFAGMDMRRKMINLMLSSSQYDLSKLLNQADDFGFSYLHVACISNDWKLVSSLLENGEDVNQLVTGTSMWRFHTPISIAIINKSEETVRTLLNFDANVNPKLSRTMIQLSIRYMSKELQDLIVAHGVKVNAYSKHGRTALHSAVKLGELNMVKRLIEYKADVNCVDKIDKWTPLHYAVAALNDEVVEVLLKEGANVNARTVDGETALHLVSRGTSSDIIDVHFLPRYSKIIASLIEAGCDINGRSYCGLTPLSHAKLNGCASSTYMFLQYGADMNLTSQAGKKTRKLKKIFDEHSVKLRILELSSNIAKLQLEESESHDDCIGDDTKENGFQKYIRQFGKNEFRGSCVAYDFPRRCVAELIRLKATPVDRYNSLYNILLKDATAMSFHVLSESFKKMLDSDGLIESFPLYGYLLKYQFIKGIIRVNFLSPAKDSLEILVSQGLPDSCSESIIKNLSNEDLKNLISATATKD